MKCDINEVSVNMEKLQNFLTFYIDRKDFLKHKDSNKALKETACGMSTGLIENIEGLYKNKIIDIKMYWKV